MVQFVNELLQEVNDNIGNLNKYKGNAVLKNIFTHAFLPESKFILPEGDPPYRKDDAPQGMTPSNMMQEIRRFYIFLRKDLTPIKREGLFISMLEGLHPKEAEVLLLIKDQNLTSKYPNITRESVASLL
jgi:hypothetical protein